MTIEINANQSINHKSYILTITELVNQSISKSRVMKEDYEEASNKALEHEKFRNMFLDQSGQWTTKEEGVFKRYKNAGGLIKLYY